MSKNVCVACIPAIMARGCRVVARSVNRICAGPADDPFDREVVSLVMSSSSVRFRHRAATTHCGTRSRIVASTVANAPIPGILR